MAGAHLDSVPAGPGINDNGSGSAALLELAQNLSKLKPENTIRLAWWGAEEAGLLGSTAYVSELPQAERDRIALYLNFDMIASPNYIFMVYDGDESSFPAPVRPCPRGRSRSRTCSSGTSRASASRMTTPSSVVAATTRRSSMRASPQVDSSRAPRCRRPPSSRRSGAAPPAQQFDPCYHQACDTIDNINGHALEINSDAIALAVLAYSYSTELVNGVVGKSVPGGLNLPDPAGPEGTFTEEDGGLSHDHLLNLH